MNDLQMLIVTAFLGGLTYVCVKYLGRIFNKAASSASTAASTVTANGGNQQKKRKVTPEKSEPLPQVEEVAAESKITTAGGKKGNKVHGKDKQPAFQHAWLMTNLKGHSGRVLDVSFSENGKMLASCADDRTVLIWFAKDFVNKEHKCVRGNIPFDHATKIKWSPDSKAFLIHCATSNQLQVHKVIKKEDGAYTVQPAVTFDSAHTDNGDVVGMDMSTNGKFIMTCSNKNDLVLYDLKGEVLTRTDTCQMTTYTARISPCGRFVATSGFTPDVKVWEVKFTRSGDFEKLSRAFELTGHTSGIFHFAFNANSSQVATLSKDGKFRVFSINIDYQNGQDPVQIVSGAVQASDINSKISLSGDGRVVVISHKTNVYFYSGLTGEALNKIENVHSDVITAMAFDAESKWLITSGDKHIRVFHNVPGFKLAIADFQDKLKQPTTEGMKERLLQQIKAAQDQIKKIEANQN